MTASRTPSGVFAPVATTFRADGELDLDGYRANMEVYARSPLDGVVILGSNGESALLVPPSDVNALAAAIKRLRDDPVLRRNLAEYAYERVMAQYTWAARVQAILEKVTSDK